jgi:hypothetical protein
VLWTGFFCFVLLPFREEAVFFGHLSRLVRGNVRRSSSISSTIVAKIETVSDCVLIGNDGCLARCMLVAVNMAMPDMQVRLGKGDM